MATVAEVLNVLNEVELVLKPILTTVEALDPALALPIEVEQEIQNMATKALAAWSAASGTAITAESVQALLTNPTPLTPPTAGL